MLWVLSKDGKMADESASFPVWVGNLAPRITESILLDLFGKFGPVKNVTILRDENGVSKQCGFVSFCAYNVSKAAAIGLDGCDVFGQIIETRGPDELVTTTHTPKVQQKKDSKVLLDCVYFVEKKTCPFKVNQCPYRHCSETQNTDKICEKWLNYECRDVKCPQRHPVINILKDKSEMKTRAMPQPRCPSHNAYKCNGECGDSECETHFMEMDDMVEHLNRARDKKAVPSGACSGCKAVFFSEEERKKHSCFQPKNLQTPFIPIYHPITAKNTCSCNPDGNSKQPITTCKACGSCYENSGDTLSTFDCSPRKTGYSGHQCPNSPSIWGGDGKHSVDLEPIGVFWDIENCPVPKGKSAIDIVKKIREEFFNNKREAEFMCVCDISKEKKEVIEDLNKSQVTVVHINATSKNAADDKLRQSLRRFAQSYPPPATVVLVSGDINFAAELSDLRHRHNLTVICLHNAQAQSALLACAHESKRFDLFTDDLAVSSAHTKTTEDSNQQVELNIGNLPIGKDVAHIKSRLRKLSENCGGKVASVTGRKAVMKFPNYQCAARAKKRMDSEDVFGSLIQVNFPSSRSNSCPTRPAKLAHTILKLQDTVDMISQGPQRVSTTMPYTKKVTKTTMEPPAIHKYSEQYYDDNLEEILCAPSHQASTVTPATAYSSQQPYVSNTSSAYSSQWQNPYCQGVVPIPTQGVGYTFPLMGPHPFTASWLANLHSLSILEQQKGGVDIAVGNLDESVSKKELKKKLASVFREHCKVYSVVLHSGEGVPLRAFVKVPKLSDAQFAVTKVNNQRIFSTSVTVTLVTEKEKELCFLSTEVTSVLKEAPLQWMPLNKFLSFFYEKCSRPFDMNVLTIVPDVVTIIGKPGCEAICLFSSDLCTTKILLEDPRDFNQEVHMLLKDHKGYLLLGNFAASYWFKFDKQVHLNESGVCLSDALEGVVNVCIKEDAGKEVVSWAKEGIINGGVFNKLEEFSSELQNLLKAQMHYRLPLSQLISSYQKWFNKKSPFDPVTYGFSSVKDLLEALPNLVMVKEDGVERFVILTQKVKLKIFETELRILLEEQPDCSLVLGHFVSAYQRCFNRKCYVQDYGFDKLLDLIDKMSHIVKVKFEGKDKMISLIESEGAKRKVDPVAIETISTELKQLFTKNKQIPVAMVRSKYHEEFGRHLNMANTGFPSLETMVISVIPGAKILDVKGERTVCFPSKDQSVQDLVELVSQQDGGFVSLKRLPVLYRKHFNKKLPFTINKLQDLVSTTNKELQILGADNDQILCYTNTSSQDHQSHDFKKLASDIHNMLIKFPGCRMSRAALSAIYHRQRGIGTMASRWPGLSTLDTLLEAMSDSIEVTGTGDFASVCLKHDHVVRCLARDVISILTSYIGKTVQVNNIPKLYEKTFGRSLSTHHYGFVNVHDMMEAMCSVVRVIGEKKNRVCLSPLQLFAIETKQLLTHAGGCVSLNRFAPCYQQYYNKPCKASDYGFSRLSEVLAAVPNVAEVRGKGVEKMVIFVADGDVLLEFIGLKQNPAPKANDQGENSRESPPIIYEGSDTESVIVEEELDDPQEISAANVEPTDLIVLSGNEESPIVNRPPSDWMMAPVPKTLPEPGLYPEQDQRPSNPQEPQDSGDLISFKEFDVSLAGLKDSLQKQCQDGEFTSEDIEVLMVNRREQEDLSINCSACIGRDAQCGLPSKSIFKSPTDHLLPVSPGMHDLSDVEAEILNVRKKNGKSNSGRKISSKKPKPTLAPFIFKETTPSKKGTTPVKLAVRFSKTP